ncbi:protein CDV3 homolog [Onychostruthus taczanowskii]|uniref:protein CDV3 homolog n=1 Tax=Onychostruthus taczanowskii TaxID=356909 RepID=UPI001B807DA2|nr:protein CDV3 homolog [Onychostruthus taczanowskii]
MAETEERSLDDFFAKRDKKKRKEKSSRSAAAAAASSASNAGSSAAGAAAGTPRPTEGGGSGDAAPGAVRGWRRSRPRPGPAGRALPPLLSLLRGGGSLPRQSLPWGRRESWAPSRSAAAAQPGAPSQVSGVAAGTGGLRQVPPGAVQRGVWTLAIRFPQSPPSSLPRCQAGFCCQ